MNVLDFLLEIIYFIPLFKEKKPEKRKSYTFVGENPQHAAKKRKSITKHAF